MNFSTFSLAGALGPPSPSPLAGDPYNPTLDSIAFHERFSYSIPGISPYHLPSYPTIHYAPTIDNLYEPASLSTGSGPIDASLASSPDRESSPPLPHGGAVQCRYDRATDNADNIHFLTTPSPRSTDTTLAALSDHVSSPLNPTKQLLQSEYASQTLDEPRSHFLSTTERRTRRDNALSAFYRSSCVRFLTDFLLNPKHWKDIVAANPGLGPCSAPQCASKEVLCLPSDVLGCTNCVRLGLTCSHVDTCLIVFISAKANIDTALARKFLDALAIQKDSALAANSRTQGGITPLLHYVSALEDYLDSAKDRPETPPPANLALNLRKAIFIATFVRTADVARVNAQQGMLHDIALILKHAATDRTLSAEQAVQQIVSLFRTRPFLSHP
ncbi:hypothetical protein CC1G_01240 [Coprinopsis cinerea okayama7|uniref:Uncharacterized protein n=1 Tax=Coprinopsis cinerea (strain Okayama-7 / 130 / ATCC MYA-4618 / FGSC 9003) TaxID=240176 RepID=A8NF02_COPC7|nr:hypothetical protein CC1G_01240 [Coprinopsis cinerea okayama7\|eukprot:XP_001833178.1 hypothetical protein CC1G_01240 [Coprinopsis cinerea okayama7\